MGIISFIFDIFLSWLAMFGAIYAAVLSRRASLLISAGFVVGVLNMALHQGFGTTINPPFVAALLFGFALRSNDFLIVAFGDITTRWVFRAFVAGTFVGWLTFAQVGTISSA